ncbi:MAG: hypothetical protein NC306_14345 [Butyrivibrio sp.]|nr:hypothetical protein [Butyrivibrio sp.]
MEPIPKPLFRRLVLTFLAGGGCFLIGLVFFLRNGDTPFFTLSILLFLSSCGKGILLFLQVRQKAYTVLEGICMDVRTNLLGGTQNICLTDAEGNEHCLVIGKDHKIRTGYSYRFYFRDPDGISPGRNPLLKKAMLTDNLMGVEELNTRQQ